MADPIKVVNAVLEADVAVTALVSDRISPQSRSQGDPLPAIRLSIVSTTPNTDLQGDGNLDEVRVQIDCYGASYTSAAALSDAVRTAISAADRVLAGRFDDYDEATETPVVTLDYLLWINPTA